MPSTKDNHWGVWPGPQKTYIGSFSDGTPTATTPIALLPGIGADANSLRLLAGELHERGHEVATFDVSKAHNQFGDHPMTYRGFSKLAELAIQSMWDDRPCHVIGHSWGGVLAQEFALTYPARVDHLGLLATTPGGRMWPISSLSVLRQMLSPDRSHGRLASIAPDLYGGDFRSDLNLINTLDIAHHVDKGAYRRQYLAINLAAATGMIYRLSDIGAPTYIVAGTDDPIVPYQNANRLKQRIPHLEIYTIDQGGHLFPMTRAAHTADIIDAFLRR